MEGEKTITRVTVAGMEKATRFFQRFTLNQRLQHVILLISMILLIITGLPLKYSDSGISQALVNLMGGWEMRAIIHRIGAVLLGGLGIYHVIMYLVFARKRPYKIMPRKKDFKDFVQQVKYYFGKAEHPKYDRYTWREKFEYWAVFWGTLIMGVTGIIMMYPEQSQQLFGSIGWVEVAWIAHSNEALLAILAIIIWHLWNAHFHPKRFPGSKVWINGKISEKDMKEEHLLEYNDIMGIKTEEEKEQGRKWRKNKLVE